MPPGTGVQAAPGLLRRGRAQTWGAGAGREQVPGPVGLALALTQSPDGPHGPAQGVREEPRAAGQEGLRGQAGSRVPPEAQPPGDHGHTGTLGSRAEARQRSPRRTGGGRAQCTRTSTTMSSSSRARLQTIKGAVRTCLVILPGRWPPPTAEGRGAQAMCQPPPASLPASAPHQHLPDTCQPALGTGEAAERGRLAETQ